MGKNDVGGSPKKSRELTEEEVRKVREARIQQQQSDPNYLKGGLTSSSSLIKNSSSTTADVDSIPIRQLSDVIPGGASGVPSLLIPGLASADQYFDPGYVNINSDTTLQSMMNVKLSKQRFRHCYENGLIKTIQMIPHNLQVSVKSASLY